MDPGGSRVAVRDARLQDVGDLEQIEKAAFTTDRLSRRSLVHHITSASSVLLVAEVRGDIAGYGLTLFRRSTASARLYSIATSSRFRGLGVGFVLLAACEQAAAARGRDALRLEVREDNLVAIALYRRSGYEPFGRYAEYYADGAPALRFSKSLVAGSDVICRRICAA